MNNQLTRRRAILAGAAGGLYFACGESVATVSAWVDRGSFGPFSCAASFPLAPLTPIFHDIAGIEHDLQRTLGLPPVRSPIQVYLLADERSYRSMLSQVYPRVPYRRALYVQHGNHSAVYAFRHRELATDLRHECTHALLHANLAMVPLWLDEGLAEYFEPPQPQRSFHNPHLSRLRWDIRLGMVRDIESLESKRDVSDMGSTEYRFSWAWVHFMFHGPRAAHAELVRFLADIRRGEPPGLLSARLRSVAPNLDQLLIQHFKRWRTA